MLNGVFLFTESRKIVFRKILLPVVNANLSRRTVEYAVHYAKAARGDIVLLSLAPTKPVYPAERDICTVGAQMNAMPICDGAGISEMVLETARRAGVHCDTVYSNSSSLSDVISEFSKRYCCDVIYLEADKNPSLPAPSISNAVITEVVKKTSISVLVFR
jgi:hypothetical protein